MRLAVVSVGRLKRGPERDLVERYRDRGQALAGTLGFGGLDLHELDEGRARRDEDRKADEGVRILAHAALQRCAIVVFDERGHAEWPSERFAERMAQWRDAGRGGTCVIGGADGLSEAVRGRADLVLSFGALTLPHQLVRVLVLEQLYRAMTILSGHPYHRGDPGR